MSISDITSITKSKSKSILDMDNQRGISLITVYKKILENLLYNDLREDLDQNMSESNIGARKGRNTKDHLVMLHGIVNEATKRKDNCVDLQVLDIEKAFDALWWEDCVNNIHDTLTDDNLNDKLVLLSEINKKNFVAVKTPFGKTERENVPDLTQQGGIFGPVSCSTSVDSLGRRSKERKLSFYKYRDTVNVIPLTYIDDCLVASKCGEASINLNTFLVTQIEMKRLKFNKGEK